MKKRISENKGRYVEPDSVNILSMIKNAYKGLPESYFFGDTEPLKRWENQPYKMSTYKPEAKIHVTSKGLRVRSKSELIIAELLYENHIPFRYEQVISI